MSYVSRHYYGLNRFKKNQLDSNRQAVFNALRILGSAQVDEIQDFLEEENKKQARTFYENGKVTRTEMKTLIKEKTLSKRTIHRHLNFLIKKALIEHHYYRYSIPDKVKGDIKYWSHEFGNSLLDSLMRSYFPHVLKFEENIEQLINIFGIYSVYCLARAAHSPTSESDKHENNLYRDSLIASWVNEVFNPLRMFDYFVAIMTSLPTDDKVENIRNNTFMKKHAKYPSRLDKIKRVDSPWSPKHITWKNGPGHMFSPDACNIRTKRFWTLLYSRAKSNDMTEGSNFVLMADIIQRIVEVLEKKYHNYYDAIIQNSQSGDIIEMTNRNQSEWEKWLPPATGELIDNYDIT